MRRQFAWNFAAQAVGLLLPSLLIIALARMLEPSDFGVFALLTITIAGIQAVSLAPLGEVIVKSDRDDIGDFIFTMQLLLGMVMSVLLLVSADHVADFFKKSELAGPLRVSCLLLLLTPLVDTAIRLNMRRIEFKAVFVRRVVSPVANALISLPLALIGMGYWALVWGQIAGILAAGIVVLSMGGWRPRLNLEIRSFHDDLRFSWQMLLQGMVRWVRSQSDKAILGYHIPSAGLGQYDMARRLAGMPFAAIVDPVAQVMYAVMVDRIRRGEEVRELFMLAQRRVLMITLPLCAIMLINARGLITIILGARWLDISAVFVVMVALGAFSSMVGSNMEVFKAKGKPHIMTRFMLLRAVVTLVVFLLLAPKGVYAIAIGALGLACVFGPINIYLTTRLLGVHARSYLARVLLRPVLIAGTVTAVNLALIRLPIDYVQTTLLNMAASGLIMVAAGLYWERDLFAWRRA